MTGSARPVHRGPDGPIVERAGTHPRGGPTIDTLKLAFLVVEAALEKKGLDPVLIHVEELVSYADYVLLVTATSTPQVDAIAQHCAQVGKEAGHRPLSIEGKGGGNHEWVLVDFGDIVLHVFQTDARSRYDLEGMWVDAAQVELPGVPPRVPNEYVASG